MSLPMSTAATALAIAIYLDGNQTKMRAQQVRGVSASGWEPLGGSTGVLASRLEGEIGRFCESALAAHDHRASPPISRSQASGSIAIPPLTF